MEEGGSKGWTYSSSAEFSTAANGTLFTHFEAALHFSDMSSFPLKKTQLICMYGCYFTQEAV